MSDVDPPLTDFIYSELPVTSLIQRKRIARRRILEAQRLLDLCIHDLELVEAELEARRYRLFFEGD